MLVLAGLVGVVLHLLKQPAIVGYVLTGLIVGPLGYLRLNNTGVLDSLSEIGITLLLFMVGLELSFKDFRQIGRVVVIAGLAQMGIITALGLYIFNLFGFSFAASLFLSLGVGFSSTIVAVKALSEQKDIESLYGKLVLGILILQDVIAILVISLISGFGQGAVGNFYSVIGILIKLAILFGAAYLASRRLFPWLVEKFSSSSEITFLFSLAWGLGFATLISEGLFHLSPEIGGFLAGLTLANTTQHLHIANKMRPLRDFFLILFFIVLGSKLIVADLSMILLGALGILLLAVVVKPIFTFLIASILGYRGRTSFLTATYLAHISEFSIILAILAERSGYLSASAVSTVTLATILSFVTGSYAMKHSHNIARFLRPLLTWWDPVDGWREHRERGKALRGHIILLGAHRIGHSILHSLEDLHKRFVVVDFNPTIVKNLKERGIRTIFGDVSDPEVQEMINLGKAKLVISTITDLEDNLSIIASARMQNSKAKLILSASNDWEARKLYNNGADYVLMPHFLSGLQLAELLRKDISLKHIDRLKNRDLELIEETE